MATVYVRSAAYEYRTLRPVLFELLAALDRGVVQPGRSVLVKPNFLAPAPPERAMTTHPLVVRAAVEYVLERGGRPQVSDSPALGTFDRVLRESGVADALRGLPVVCRPFTESVEVDVGPPFHRIEIAADAMRADAVINLPKLKTHAQMRLTLGVKNTFGCVVGLRKPQWHLRAGVDTGTFADVLVRVHAAVRPAITLLDGVLAMEGQGPGRGGVPRPLGVVMAGADAAAVDAAVCSMVGLDEDDLLTTRAAKRAGLTAGAPTIDGALPSVPDLRLPEAAPLVFGPRPLHRLMRRHLVQRPVCDAALCRHCGECWRLCPARAIGRAQRGLRFDYDRCIRCYCCVEVCPHGALAAHEPAIGRLVRRLGG